MRGKSIDFTVLLCIFTIFVVSIHENKKPVKLGLYGLKSTYSEQVIGDVLDYLRCNESLHRCKNIPLFTRTILVCMGL